MGARFRLVLISLFLAAACFGFGSLAAAADDDWQPYPSLENAKAQVPGRRRGRLFPNVLYIDADGVKRTMREHLGKVVIFNWWASWCGPCKREWPELQALYDELKDEKDIVWIFMNIAEKYEVSRDYARSQGYTVPIAESIEVGIRTVPTADGGTFGITSIPKTWVLDQNNVVIEMIESPRAALNRFSAYRFRNLLRRDARAARN